MIKMQTTADQSTPNLSGGIWIWDVAVEVIIDNLSIRNELINSRTLLNMAFHCFCNFLCSHQWLRFSIIFDHVRDDCFGWACRKGLLANEVKARGS